MKESEETPSMEAKSHSAGFLKSAVSKAAKFGKGSKGSSMKKSTSKGKVR